MKRRRFLRRLLGIVIVSFFILGNIVLPAYAGILEGRNTYAAPTLLDPFGPLDPGGWGQMRQPGPDNIAGMAGSLAPKGVPVDVKSLNGLGDNQDHVSATGGSVNLQVTARGKLPNPSNPTERPNAPTPITPVSRKLWLMT